jgi:hypothetical protein
LIELRIHDITLDYIRDARSAGYRKFVAQDLSTCASTA